MEEFRAWCRQQGICPDCGMNITGQTDENIHPCDPAAWYGPPIPEGMSQYPEGMTVHRLV